jgi:hypothetical protein
MTPELETGTTISPTGRQPYLPTPQGAIPAVKTARDVFPPSFEHLGFQTYQIFYMNVMEFFQLSAGKWRSQRTTHHLPFRRSETGDSEIWVEALVANHPKIIDICHLHQIDPGLAIGGAYVNWQGSMAWDREGEDNHEGSTVFALVPDDDHAREGQMLRERGYAEIVPVIGRYQMDDEDGLVLTTDYETMSSIERFWFVTPDLRFRSSTVKRFGGFSTASFCSEFRIQENSGNTSSLDIADISKLPPQQVQDAIESREFFSVFGW